MAPALGLRSVIAVQVYRYDIKGPYAYAKYACAPPFNGIIDPSSANELNTRVSFDPDEEVVMEHKPCAGPSQKSCDEPN
jgi:hypothetical protein